MKLIAQKVCENVGKSITETLTADGRQLKFGNLQGKPLICNGKTTPYKRCLNFHASRACDYAMDMGWIKRIQSFKYSWSENFDEAHMANYLAALGTSYEDLGPDAFNDLAPDDD
jgi:hypothetical protein